MNGDIAQWFGLSFQRPIQGSMTLFFELSIFAFVILFFALTLLFFLSLLLKYCHFFGIQGSNFLAYDSAAPPPLQMTFLKCLFLEKRMWIRTAGEGNRGIKQIRALKTRHLKIWSRAPYYNTCAFE